MSKKYNVYFTMCGPGGEKEVPNNTNPIACVNLASLLAKLATNLPGGNFGLSCIGVRVEAAEAGGEE